VLPVRRALKHCLPQGTPLTLGPLCVSVCLSVCLHTIFRLCGVCGGVHCQCQVLCGAACGCCWAGVRYVIAVTVCRRGAWIHGWPGGMVDVPSDATKLVDRRQREERKQRLAAAGRGLAALEAAQPALWASLLSSQFDALFYEPQESQWALCRPLFPLIMGNREVRLLLRAGVCPQHTSL